MSLNEFFPEKDKAVYFDYVVGNPPYQCPEKGSAKLYKPIFEKSLLLSKEVSLLMPDAIVRGDNSKYHIKSVDYTADHAFTVTGVHIAEVVSTRGYSGDIKVTNADYTVEYRSRDGLLLDRSVIPGYHIYQKLKAYAGGKLFTDGSGKNSETKSSDYPYKVYKNKDKDTYWYHRDTPIFYKRKKLNISATRKHLISAVDISTSDSFNGMQIDITGYTERQINNIYSFVFSDIVFNIYNIGRYMVYLTGFNPIISLLPDIDIDTHYTESTSAELLGLSAEDVEWINSNITNTQLQK